MSKPKKGPSGPVVSETAPGEGQGKGSAQLCATVRGKPFAPGADPRRSPGGQSKEKRAFLERLKSDDADEIYAAFMGLVRDGNAPAILRAVEYLAGKPPNATEDNEAIRQSLTVVVQSLAAKAGGEG